MTPTAPLGNARFRLATPDGLSNPLVFNVGELPEFSKKDWKNVPKAKLQHGPGSWTRSRPSKTSPCRSS